MTLFKSLMKEVSVEETLTEVSEDTANLIIALEDKAKEGKRRLEEENQRRRAEVRDALVSLAKMARVLQAASYDPETATAIVLDLEKTGPLNKIVMAGRALSIVDAKPLSTKDRADKLTPLEGGVFAAADLLRRVGYLAGRLEAMLTTEPEKKQPIPTARVKVYTVGRDASVKIGDIMPISAKQLLKEKDSAR